jgi:hypothetical protein
LTPFFTVTGLAVDNTFQWASAESHACHVVAAGADTVAPVVTGRSTPPPNANGWNQTPFTVQWTATDPAPSAASVLPDVGSSTPRARNR